MKHKVAILGASPKEERYSNKAMMMLLEAGHEVYPVHPAVKQINGHQVYAHLSDIKDNMDTLTLYLSPVHQESLVDEIIQHKPGRVIFNPGTESDKTKSLLDAHGIPYMDACTLVLLRTSQF